MSDFIYNIVSSSSPGDGEAAIDANEININTVNVNGLDNSPFLELWSYDAFRKLPFDLKARTDTGAFVLVEVTDMSWDFKGNGRSIQFSCSTPAELLTGAVLEIELGLKARSKESPCGGYEEMTITKEDNPTCVNSCTFKNTVSGREFSFNNIDLGTYDFRFEGPNERYEIIWGPPQFCDDDKVRILNRVEGKKLKLEDYGNSPNSEDINFVDLIVEVKYGSYEWAGGDTDTVYYITANNGALCAPGEICVNGQCVSDGSINPLDHEDILLIHDGSIEDNLYKVRAGDYKVRAKTNYSFPLTRAQETFQSGPSEFKKIQEQDSVAVYRPSESTVYKISGKQYIDEFQYLGVIQPVINSVSLQYDNPEPGLGLAGKTFRVTIDGADTSGSTRYKAITRVFTTLVDTSQMSQTINIFVAPDESLKSKVNGEDITFGYAGDFSLMTNGPAGTFSQESGASFTFDYDGSNYRRYDHYSWRRDRFNNRYLGATSVQNFDKIDFSKPFTNNTLFTVRYPYTSFIKDTGTLDPWPEGAWSVVSDNIETCSSLMVDAWTRSYSNSIFSHRGSGINGFTHHVTDVKYDPKTRTLSGLWDSGARFAPYFNEESNKQQYDLFENVMDDGKDGAGNDMFFSFTTDIPHVGWHFMDINPESGAQPNKITDNGYVSDLGTSTTFRFTVDPSITKNNQPADGVLEKYGAYMSVDVYAENSAGWSELVGSNYLQIFEASA